MGFLAGVSAHAQGRAGYHPYDIPPVCNRQSYPPPPPPCDILRWFPDGAPDSHPLFPSQSVLGDRCSLGRLCALPSFRLLGLWPELRGSSSISFLPRPSTVPWSSLRKLPWVVAACSATKPACVAPFACEWGPMTFLLELIRMGWR